MKTLITLLSTLYCLNLAAQDDIIFKGRVVEYPNQSPLQGINIYADGSGSVTSNTFGIFTLRFSRKKYGYGNKINLFLRKETLKTYSLTKRHYFPIEAIIRSNPNEIFILELCRKGNCHEDVLYKKIVGKVNKNTNKQIARLKQEISRLPHSSKRVVQLRDSIALLLTQKQEKEAQILELTKRIVRTDFRNAASVTKKAIKYIEKGQIDRAISVLRNANIQQELKAISEEEKKLYEQQKKLAKKEKKLKEKKNEYISAQLTLARSYALNFEKENAVSSYETVVMADSANLKNIIEFANYLRNNNYYEKALWYYNKIIKSKNAQQWHKANAYGYLGDIYKETDDLPQALSAYQKAQKVYEKLHAGDKQNTFYFGNLIISYERLGLINQRQSDFDKALKYFILQTKSSEELYKSNPGSEALKKDLAIAYERLGSIYQEQDSLGKAQEYFTLENKLFEELYKANHRNESLKNGLAISYEKLGETYQRKSNFDKALEYFMIDMNLMKELYEANSQSEIIKNGLAISYSKLGEVYQAQGDLSKALEYFTLRYELGKELYEANPDNFKLYMELGISYHKLGDISQALENKKGAINYYEKAMEIFGSVYKSKKMTKYKSLKAFVGNKIAKLRGTNAEKIIAQKKLIEQYKKERQTDNIKTIISIAYGNLSWYYLFEREFSEAGKSALIALEYDNTQEWVYTNLAHVLLFKDKYEEAKKIYMKMKEKPYTYSDNYGNYGEVFLSDLKELQKVGITHSDMEKIINLLNDQ